MSHAITAVLADIGGTNTRVALAAGPTVQEASVKRYRNAEWSGIGAVLRDYLDAAEIAPDAACVAMAGPVRDSAGKLTNLDWEVNREILQNATGARTLAVLNDMQRRATRWGTSPSRTSRRCTRARPPARIRRGWWWVSGPA